MTPTPATQAPGRARPAVDPGRIERLLDEALRDAAERRGSATRLPFQATYDREGRYPVQGRLYRSERAVVLLTLEALFRAGDTVYLRMNAKSVAFRISRLRRGQRPGDAAGLRVVYLVPG
jgi:hypothetical protein